MRGGKLSLSIVIFTLAVILASASACTAAADEFRGFWITAWSAGFLNQSQVDTLLGVPGDATRRGTIRDANCNAVVVQVRRSADVCYPSGVGEPYFSSLSPADFNALQAIINAAHDTTGGKQRIEVHAWIVVFRTDGGVVYQAHHDTPTGSLTNLDNYWPTRLDSGAENGGKAFDPGHPLAQEYLVNMCMDLVNRFDIDGIHYDYIRFYANNEGYNPTSVARYNARYGLTGQPLAADEQWKQWRRDQVTALVRKVYAKIQSSKPWVKQTAAVVTWSPSPSSSTRSAFQATRPYYDVYSDWDAWMQEGILDMVMPMNYYDQNASYAYQYVDWMNFMKDRKFNRHAAVGPGIYKNSLQNAIDQLLMTRNPSPAGNYGQGFCGYSYQSPFTYGGTNYGPWSEFAPQLISQVTSTPANIPPMPWKTAPTKGHISGTVTYAANGKWIDGATVTITGPANRTMLCDGTGFYAFIDLPVGTYTVTASKAGYPNVQKTVDVAIGQITGNMYVTDLSLGGTNTVISNVNASSITANSAVISWTTDQASSSKVEYGLTTSYGSATPIDNNLLTTHSMTLIGLTAHTQYHFRVVSANTNGTSTSIDYTFTTSGPPTIDNVQATDVTSTSAKITWSTNVPASGNVNYGTTTSYGSQASDPNTGTSHSVTLTGLTPDTVYHYQCVSSNAYGTATSTDYTFTTPEFTIETIVDNTDSGWANASPNGNTWSAGSSAAVPKIGTNYLYSSGDGSLTETSSTRKCRWTPNLAMAGYYDVYVYYQIGSNRNTAAPYKVYYDGGQATSIQNQYSTTANQGGWFLVGQNLPFNAGTSGYVELTTLSTDTKYVSADAAKWVYRGPLTPPDTQAPNIASVYVDPIYAAAGDPLHVTVYALDNVAVTGVTADGVSLSHTSTSGGVSRYDGIISADSLLGEHRITAVAVDAAGNSATSTGLASYRTVPIVGLPSKSLFDSMMATAQGRFAFKTWGTVSYINADEFDLLNPGQTPVWVHCINHGFGTGDFVSARGIWTYYGAPRPWLTCQPIHVRKFSQ